MKLSIIIPVYNSEKYINNCLESLLAQEMLANEYEIIIVNDGSTDSSGLIVRNYTERHSNIHLFNQKNKGVGAARNRGIELAKGDYIYLIDPDDYIVTNILKNILEYCESKRLEILGFNSRLTKNSLLTHSSTQNLRNKKVHVMDGITYIAEHTFGNSAWWYLIQRDFLTKTGIRFIEGRWLEDAIFTATLFLKTKRMSFLDLDVHIYVSVENSAMTSKEPAHCMNLIYDLANAAEKYQELIKNLDASHFNYDRCVKRLKCKQQSFVFTLLIRTFKSQLNFRDLKKILFKMKNIGAYPLNSFIGEEYNGFIYRARTVVFNNDILLFLGFKVYRFMKNFKP